MMSSQLLQLSTKTCSGMLRASNLMKYQCAGLSRVPLFGKNQVAITRCSTMMPINAKIQGLLSNPVMTTSVRATNTASGVPPAAHGHDHSRMWNMERILSAALIAVIPASFYVPTPAMNYALALSLVVHTHWGLEAIVVDYIRPSVFGPVIPKVALGTLYLLSILTLAGLFYFNYTDVGLVTGLRMLGKV